MQWWDSAETLYRIGFWLTLIASTAALLSLIANYRVRSLDGRDIESLRFANQRLEERTGPRLLNPTPELKAALSTDPRGQVYFIIEHFDTSTLEYGTQWRNLLRETGWGDKGTIINPQQIAPRQIPPGITLVIHKETPYALHFRDVLVSHHIPVNVTFPGPADPSGLYDSSREVVLFIGRRP